MVKELVVTLTQIIEARLSIGCRTETILGTFAVAGKTIGTFLALTGQFVLFILTELQLPVAIHHFYQGVGVDIAQLVLWKDKMVARINIAVEFDYPRMPTGLGKGTDTRLFAYPVGQCSVEQLDIEFSDIVSYPLIEDGAQEIPPLLRSDGKVGQGSELFRSSTEARCRPSEC